MTRNGKDPGAIGHNDVLSLASDSESSFFEGPNGVQVVNTGNLGHRLRDVDFANHRTLQEIFAD